MAWKSVSSVNGPIEQYVLNWSTTVQQLIGSVVYNGTQLSHTVTNLTAATHYFFQITVSYVFESRKCLDQERY